MNRRQRESLITWILTVAGFVVGFIFSEQIFAFFNA